MWTEELSHHFKGYYAGNLSKVTFGGWCRWRRRWDWRWCCCCCCYQVASVVSDSVRPHRRQPARLHSPWDSPGKNTGVACHFLLQCVKVKSESEVTQVLQPYLTLRNPMDYSPTGSFVHGIFRQEYWNRLTDIYICIESTCNTGDINSIPGSGWSPGRGNNNPLQYSCLGNPMDRESWRAIFFEVTKVRHDLETIYTHTYI